MIAKSVKVKGGSMKKIVLSVLVIVSLTFLSLTAFARPHGSTFSNSTSTLFFDGAMKTANVTVLNVGTTLPHIILHRIAKNRRGPNNMTVAFDNQSGTTAGTVSFPDDGVWLGFNGTFLLRRAEQVLAGQNTGVGVIRLDNHDSVTFDPATGTFTGSGTVVQFTGAVDIAGVLRRDGNRAVIKAKIHPAAASELVFSNGLSVPFMSGGTLVNSVPVVVKFSVPAVQMIRRLP
jgi:hypothetical protein